MKRIILLLVLIVSLESCTNKIVQLPETHNLDITEIKDVSPAYLFYDETKKDSVELNRKNLIITTNWLVNVDKRLKLKQAIPSIVFLQNKKRNAEVHKNENAKNYFTCSNPNIQKLAFIEFTDVVYHMDSSEKYYRKVSNIPVHKRIIIAFISSNKITYSSLSDDIFAEASNNKSLMNDLKNIMNKENVELILNFNQNLAFQDYITFKSLLLKLNLNNVTISNNEFIY
jgi:hypothetical protein